MSNTATTPDLYSCLGCAGKFNRHIDYWDAVDNQDFFSFEAFLHVLSQMSNTATTPDLYTPKYTVLKKFKELEVRRFVFMATALHPSTLTWLVGSSTSIAPGLQLHMVAGQHHILHAVLFRKSRQQGGSQRAMLSEHGGNKVLKSTCHSL
jgi:hypothetical protein